ARAPARPHPRGHRRGRQGPHAGRTRPSRSRARAGDRAGCRGAGAAPTQGGCVMGRIRSIKPEFPQSESMGNVSRDARLLFVLLWPICDDHGRTRAASRMLASTLFPYDEDARGLIDGWMDELEREGCIRRYQVDGSAYLEICNWLKHQKIDRPSKPQFPEP